MAFLYPYFLFALGAIVIPIILHLIQLRRAKRIAFSNVRFIQASQEVTSSQRKLKNLLILLARILFISFLVLAFAQPFIPGTSVVSDNDNSVALLIDNSYSMQNMHAEQDISLLTYATDKARAVLDLFPSNSVFSVLDNSSYSGNKYPSSAEVRFALNNLDYTPTNSQSPFTTAGHLFVLSDFQKNKFKASVLTKVDSGTQIHLLPLEAANNANVFIDTVFLEDAFVRVGGEAALHIKVKNTATEDINDLPLKLIINQQQVATQSIDLAAGQITESIINFRINENSITQAYVMVEHYPVEFDNTYYFVLATSESIKVVEIADGGELELKNLYSKEPSFRYSLYQPASIDYSQVSTADIIILNGLKEISNALSATLGNYIKQGGSLLVIPPATGNLAGYPDLFNQNKIGANISAVNTQYKSDLVPPAADNPFFKGIFADYDRKMQMPSATRNLRWSRATEDILKFRGGSSFLSRFERGNGQVYLMSSPLHEDHNSLVNHALLLPVMYKIAISAYKQQQPLAYTLGGTTIKYPITQKAQGEGIYKLEKDSLAFIPEQQIRGGSLYFNIPPDLNEAGIYKLTLEGKTIGTVAFNYDNRESILDQYTPDELRAMLPANYKNIHVYDYGDALSVKNEFEKRFFGVKLWKYCLILCLLFLMAEIALIRFL